MTSSILNLSAYRFVTLDALDALRQHIADRAAAAGLRGTVLLAEEGINLFVAGEPAAARAWLAGLGEDPRLAGLQARESFSDTLPFRRLRVKIKREIIRMDQPTVRPAAGRAPVVDAPICKACCASAWPACSWPRPRSSCSCTAMNWRCRKPRTPSCSPPGTATSSACCA